MQFYLMVFLKVRGNRTKYFQGKKPLREVQELEKKKMFNIKQFF